MKLNILRERGAQECSTKNCMVVTVTLPRPAGCCCWGTSLVAPPGLPAPPGKGKEENLKLLLTQAKTTPRLRAAAPWDCHLLTAGLLLCYFQT